MSDNTITVDRAAVAASDLASAVQALKQPGASRADTEAAILGLIATFGKSDRQAVLDELSALPLEAFVTLEAIRATLALAERGDRFEELAGKLRRLLEPGAPIPHWTCEDRLKRFKNKSSFEIVNLLALIKYAQGSEQFEDLDDAARFYASRLDLPDDVINLLYEHTTSRSLDKAGYAQKLKEGFVVEHILNDLCRRRGDNDDTLPTLSLNYKSLWAEGSFEDPTRTQDGKRKATVFLTCHSGMMDHVKLWYKTVFEDGVRMGSGASDKIVSSRDNPNAALLEAYRAAMQGKPLLIAADSPMGTAKNELTVFGRRMSVADGFVFLAFESRADVYFAIVVPQGGRMTLRAVQGPGREAGEKIADYRPRLLRFVEEQIEAYLAGPPEQIGLRKKWLNVLGGADPGDSETD